MSFDLEGAPERARRLLIRVFVTCTAVVPTLAAADEGMWTLDNPPLQKIQGAYGFAPGQHWLDKVIHASARIAGECSASFVSKGGLVLTNNHCVAECAEHLSSAQHDFLKEGFIARRRADEARCPAMEIDRLEKISDVTDTIKKATAGLEGEAYKLARNAIEANLTSACAGAQADTTRCDVVDLYRGGQYTLYRYHRFQDVRLVFAPELMAAFFGGDPDNFNFPRYDLDMSLLRVYEDNQPASVNDYFPVSAKGASDGELVFVTGHPGYTQRELTVAQLSTLRELVYPDVVSRLAEYRGVLEQYRTEGSEPARFAASEAFFTDNSFKALRGLFEALLDPRLLQAKREEEAALRSFAASRPEFKTRAAGAWDAIEHAEGVYRDLYQPLSRIGRGPTFLTAYFGFARTLVRGAAERPKPNAERLPEFSDAGLPEVEANLFSTAPIHPEFEKLRFAFSLTMLRERLGADHPLVKQVLGKESPEQLAAHMVEATQLGDAAVRRAIWTGGQAAIDASKDPFIRLAVSIDPAARALRKRYEAEVESVEEKSAEQIAQVRFARSGTDAYPDATFTLRLSYGQVKGWTETGTPVPAFTNFAGAYERATGADPFRLPASWIRAHDRLQLATPLNFVTTNDIIGGNSGSPVIDKDARLVGLIFDGNIHSLGGSFEYDISKNRAVAVDSAAILEALDKIYDASSLADELRAD